jgi:hypothetical protein
MRRRIVDLEQAQGLVVAMGELLQYKANGDSCVLGKNLIFAMGWHHTTWARC